MFFFERTTISIRNSVKAGVYTNLRSAFLQRSYDWNKHCFIVRLEQFGQQRNTICFPDGLLVFSAFTAAP